MLRFLGRFLGIWLVAAALVLGLVDGAKSIAASGVRTTPLADALAMLNGSDQPLTGIAAPWPLDAMLEWLLAVPSALVLLTLGVVLLIAGRRRHRRRLGHEFAI